MGEDDYKGDLLEMLLIVGGIVLSLIAVPILLVVVFFGDALKKVRRRGR